MMHVNARVLPVTMAAEDRGLQDKVRTHFNDEYESSFTSNRDIPSRRRFLGRIGQSSKTFQPVKWDTRGQKMQNGQWCERVWRATLTYTSGSQNDDLVILRHFVSVS